MFYSCLCHLVEFVFHFIIIFQELDDPLLETTIPMQFIIGENAVMTSLDDMEDFRERMTKTETSLIVVGGADDKLVVSNLKKRLECITQSMVDRCVADEIFVFLSDLLLKSDDSNATDSKPFSMFMSMGTPLQSPRASKPKKPSKKRPLPSTEDGATSARPMDPNAIVVKPPPKKKRAPPKPKTPVPNPEAKPGELTPMLIPISSLPPNFQPHLFPNLTAVLNGTPQEKMNLDNIRQYLSCPIKAENAKMISGTWMSVLTKFDCKAHTIYTICRSISEYIASPVACTEKEFQKVSRQHLFDAKHWHFALDHGRVSESHHHGQV